jgi:hypothetical protein
MDANGTDYRIPKQPTPEEIEKAEVQRAWAVFWRDLNKEADEWPSIFIRQYGQRIFQSEDSSKGETKIDG